MSISTEHLENLPFSILQDEEDLVAKLGEGEGEGGRGGVLHLPLAPRLFTTQIVPLALWYLNDKLCGRYLTHNLDVHKQLIYRKEA